MVVLRYLKSYIQPVPSVQIVGTTQTDISRKSSDDGGGWGVGGGWHYIFPIYDFMPHSTIWTPNTGSVAKWPRHDATLEGGGFFEREGLMKSGGLLIFFHSWPILSTRFQWTKPGVQWSLVETRVHLSYRKSSHKMKPEVYRILYKMALPGVPAFYSHLRVSGVIKISLPLCALFGALLTLKFWWTSRSR